MGLFSNHDPHHHRDGHGHPGGHRAPMMRGYGDMVVFSFKQKSLFGNDKHVHVQLWLDGHLLSHGSHGTEGVTVQLQPGSHTVGIAVYNPDAMFDARHARQPESTASFVLADRRPGLLSGLFPRQHDRHVQIEYAVRQNLLTKAATAEIRSVRELK